MPPDDSHRPQGPPHRRRYVFLLIAGGTVVMLGIEMVSPGFLLGMGLGFGLASLLYFVILPAVAYLLWSDDQER